MFSPDTSVDGGTGDDNIKVTHRAYSKSTVHGWDGDDTIEVLINNGKVDGGEGTDKCRYPSVTETWVNCES